MSIESIEFENFTVFKKLDLALGKGVNIFIGENGTGKTHVLKAIYGICQLSKTNDINNISKYFANNLYKKDFFAKQGYPLFAKVNAEEIRNKEDKVHLVGRFYLPVHDMNRMIKASEDETSYKISYPIDTVDVVFIPAKEMLSHSNGLSAMSKKYEKFPFDQTLIDIIEKAQQWRVKEIPPIAKKIIPKLENIIDGTILLENDTFYVKKRNGLKVEFSVEAEGIKKIGLLWQLLMNESITEGTVLLWDEPESNINPKIIPEVVEILLELQRNGGQVFLATHNYLLAKYFEVRRKDTDMVEFHSLYKTEQGVVCESNSDFRNLKNNPVITAFDQLLDEVYNKNLGD